MATSIGELHREAASRQVEPTDVDDDAPPPATAERTRIGDFTLLRRIGRGGQGEVYEARQESLGRRVALKVFSSGFAPNEERLQRFRREAAAGGRLAHPNIVSVHAVGEDGGAHYIAQELVEGGRTLADMIDTARRLPELERDWYEQVARLFVQLADALHSAHEAGIIHRDVKPGNILLTKDGRPKVADFGLALVDDDLLRSRSGALLGTPFYMSPEQVTGRRLGIDRRTDVFSLGTTFYEALTLRRPFEGDSRESIVQAIVLHDPPDPRKLRGRVPPDLAVICLKALEKRPERRYASAAEFGADLRRHLVSEPIHAQPPGSLVRAQKWMRRHPLAVAQVVVIAGLLSWLAAMMHAKSQAEAGQAALLRGRAATQEFERTQEEVIRLIGDLAGASQDRDPDEQVRRFADRLSALMPTIPRTSDVHWYVHVVAGGTYRRVGEYAKAADLLERALELARAMPDDEESDQQANIARASYELGCLRRETGDEAEAETLLLDALGRYGRVMGPDAAQLDDVVIQLAKLYLQMGRRAEAETYYRRFLDGARHGKGRGGMVGEAQAALGEFLLMQGRLDEAAEQLLPAWAAGATDVPDAFHWHLGRVMAWLSLEQGRRATAQRQPERAAGHFARADELFGTVLAGQRALYGGPHEDVARTLVTQGSLLRELGRAEEARAAFEEAITIAETTVGPGDELTLSAWNNLAVVLYKSGDKAGAEAAWQAIVEADRESALDTTEPALNALENLAKLCFNARRFDEALGYAGTLVERTPGDHPEHDTRLALLDKVRTAAAPLAENN